MPHPEHLEILPLGGLGEFGMNSTLLRFRGRGLLVDAGMMFPGPEHPGVDSILPDLSPLDGAGTIELTSISL